MPRATRAPRPPNKLAAGQERSRPGAGGPAPRPSVATSAHPRAATSIWERLTPALALEVGWLAAVALVPLVFFRGSNEAFELPKQAVFRTLLVASLASAGAIALARRVGRGRQQTGDSAGAAAAWTRQLLRWPPALVALAVVAAWVLATALSVAPAMSWWGSYQRWAGLRTELSYLALFLVAAATLTRRPQAVRLAAAAGASASVVAAYALIQRLGWDPLAWNWGELAGWATTRTGMERPFSTFGNPDFLGSYLLITLFLTLGAALGSVLSLASPERESARRPASTLFPFPVSLASRPPLAFFLFMTAFLLQALVLLLTQSRAAWVGAAAGLACLALLLVLQHRGPWLRWLLAGAAMALLLAGGLWLAQPSLPSDGLLARAASIFRPTEGSASLRLVLWRATLPLVAERPLLGYGPDMLGSVIVRHYQYELLTEEHPVYLVDRAHNAVLDTLATVGFVGGMALLAVGILVAWTGWLLLRGAGPPRSSGGQEQADRGLAGHALLPAFLAALVAHLVEQQFDFEVVGVSLLAWLLAGAILGSAWRPVPGRLSPIGGVVPAGNGRPGRRRRAGGSGWTSVILTAGVAATVVAAAWFESLPLRADIIYSQGLLAERRGRFAEAGELLLRAASTWPLEFVYWNELAKVRFELARTAQGANIKPAYQQAVAAADEALRRNPAHPLVWSNWGLIAGEAAVRSDDRELGERARQAHAVATGWAPNYWLYWRNAGATEFALGDFGAAQQSFERAVPLWGANDLSLWGALGEAAAAAGDFPTARRAFEKIASMNPTDERARQALERLPR